MDGLMYEDKSGQPELLRKQDDPHNGDSKFDFDDSSDSEQECLFKPGSSKTSSCWEDLKKITNKTKKCAKKKQNDEVDESDIYLDMGQWNEKPQNKFRAVSDLDNLMENCVIKPGFNRLREIPKSSTLEDAKLRKAEREKTTGSKWFNMPAPEMTNALQRELQALQMRSVTDPKQFYKKNIMNKIPKYFQCGRVVESKAEYYSSRIPNRDRKKTLVDELLANAEFQKYNKKRFAQIIGNKKGRGFKAHKVSKKPGRKH